MPAREYELATGNLLMGRFTWIYIYVPEGWSVKLGDAPADVNYTSVVKGVGWVLDGSSSYYVVNLVGGEVVELDLRCRKGVRNPGLPKEGFEASTVNGHNCFIGNRTVKRGLRRKLLTQSTLTIPCPETSRTIEAKFTSSSAPAVEELKKLFPHYRCH